MFLHAEWKTSFNSSTLPCIVESRRYHQPYRGAVVSLITTGRGVKFMKIEIENEEFVDYVKTHGGVISIGNFYQVVG